MRLSLIFICALILSTFTSCEKDQVSSPEEYGVLSFGTVSSTVTPELRSVDKQKLSDVRSAVITITKDGKVYEDFKLKTIKVNLWGGSNFTTEDVKLKIGSGYKLEHFALKNDEGKVIFASPKKGSALASKVSKPLSIDFAIKKDERTAVEVEVISTANTTPADFGYAYFVIKVPGNKYRLIKKDIYRDSDKASFIFDYTYSTGDQINYFTINGKDKTFCKYDDKGRIIEEYEGDLKNTYTYNDKGQLTEYHVGIVKVFWRKDVKHIYSYDAKGNRTFENMYYVQHDGSLELIMRIDYQYKNSVCDMKIVNRADKDGKLYKTEYIKVITDANNNVESETEYSYTDNKKVMTTKFFYEEF
ncbi:MAG: hypothetical protein N4A72_00095 [Bacteroidales bacterium]|jgi:hypothetical protein|nr:hypothetical protein [Bacteroidales bacterium]